MFMKKDTGSDARRKEEGPLSWAHRRFLFWSRMYQLGRVDFVAFTEFVSNPHPHVALFAPAA